MHGRREVGLAIGRRLEIDTGQLGEALSGRIGCHRSVVDLTADRALKHGRVDEGGLGMGVTRQVAARAVCASEKPPGSPVTDDKCVSRQATGSGPGLGALP
jgi:hypothetical protein